MQGFSLRNLLFALVIMLVVSSAVAAFADELAKITDIQIKGNKKVETQTIISKLEMKVGDDFYPSMVRNDVSNVYKMGYFDDVQVEAEGHEGGLRLIFTVVERPIVRSYSFEGNVKLETDKLRENVSITPYTVYNPSLVGVSVERLKLYAQGEGYFNAEVLPIINRISDKEVKIIFQINEGDKVRIARVNIDGNENISDRKIRKAMATKKYFFLWSWVMKTGTYKVIDFQMDLERIKGLYYNNGYIQVSIDEPVITLNEDKTRLTISLNVHEGEQFSYSSLDIEGNTVFTKEELFEQVQSKPGDIMNRDKLKRDVIALTDMYGSEGYAYATISPLIDPNIEDRTVAVTLQATEGEKIYVDRINISGNTKTRDKVIRRELKLTEGGIYDTTGTKRTEQRLTNLDFFEKIEIVPHRTLEDNTVDLEVKVEEKSTGSFSVGGGYSTIDRLVAIAEVTQNNFLGRGQSLSFKGQLGKRRQDYNLSFTEPWLLDMPVSLRLDLYKEERVYTGYSKKSTGGGISLGKRFWEYWGANLSYGYSIEKYFDVEEIISTQFSEAIELEATSKVGFSLYRDTRDNYIDSRSGNRNSIYVEYAGKNIGSENAYIKYVADSTWFFPFWWDTAFSLHGKAGYAEGLEDKDLPLYERFYVGGINTVRGFDWGELGPKARVIERDPDTNEIISIKEGQPIGGDKELIFNAEYTFPLVPTIKLRGVVFFDAGNAFGNEDTFDISDLRYSTGAGFRWLSPMGLIRLEYGYILDRKEDESPGKWEFSVGAMF